MPICTMASQEKCSLLPLNARACTTDSSAKKSCQVPPNSHAPLLYMQMFTDAYLNNQWELCLACQWLLYLLMLVFLPLADDDNDWLILDCMPCCLKQQQQITFSITALYRREEARGKGLALLA